MISILSILRFLCGFGLLFSVCFVCESLSLSLLFCKVLMVDGNGILHPRGIKVTQKVSLFVMHLKLCNLCGLGFGLACHLGVLAHLPTIGVGKNVPSSQNLYLFLLVYIIFC